jgi:hypothetical protein
MQDQHAQVAGRTAFQDLLNGAHLQALNHKVTADLLESDRLSIAISMSNTALGYLSTP